VDKSLVLGFRSACLGASVPDNLLIDYIGRSNGRVIGIAAVDPTQDDALDHAAKLLARSEFRGITISPAAQNFHPCDSRAQRIYEFAASRCIPIFITQNTHFHPRGRMEYARPALLDEVANDFPTLTIVISALGHPWVEEGVALLGKHPRAFSDVAGLVRRSWQAYNALVLAHQFNVMDKILFGSDFPYSNAAEAIENLYRLHMMTHGTSLPTVPRDMLRSVVERDALTALGIARPGDAPGTPTADEEEL